MFIVYIDIILLIILLTLSVFTCVYCVYRVNRMRRSGQLQIQLRPTKVVFTHKSEIDQSNELRTVVAYQNPFTGDYCVHKSRVVGAEGAGTGYVNQMERYETESEDSGVSDAYEPLRPDPQRMVDEPTRPDPTATLNPNSVNKTWNWNYKEYQI